MQLVKCHALVITMDKYNMLTIYIVLLLCYSPYQEIFGQCPATSTVSVGYTSVTVSPPGYPSPGYDRNLSCSWLGSSSISGASILYRVTDITANCPGDTINVYNGADNTGTHVHINECNSGGSGSRTLGYKVSSTGKVYTTFTSDASQSASELGFKMYMISGKDLSGTGCTPTQTLTATTTEQYLSSPNFPNTYPKNQTCIWEISATDSSANIIIDIKFLNIEFDSSCIYDYLEISESGISRTKLCSEDTDTDWDPAKTYTSTGNSITVKMRSDNYQVRNGFLLSYIRTGTVTTEAVTTEATTVTTNEQSTTEQQTTESSTTNTRTVTTEAATPEATTGTTGTVTTEAVTPEATTGTTGNVTTEAVTPEATTGTTVASSSNTSSTDPKDSDDVIIAGFIVGALVVVGVVIAKVVPKKDRSKQVLLELQSKIKKQAFIEEE